ncbi:MICOS complex subunit Mic10-like [Eupeodes corollae]|uniref:MICOS complex subunit Mic10-like n=1 Tax=Eupeodes corollae TaxID=290404 RepID=UPI00248FF5EF|nr:MICOS complex subunit Mic10-like [Eupeodes corollae]
MSENKAKPTFSEDEFGKKLDRCVTDTLIKAAGGLALGTVFSLLFFKRRSWPAIMGTGFGIGVAYRTCERDLNSDI